MDSGTEVVSKRIKVIKMADESDFGYSTVNKYLSDELTGRREGLKEKPRKGVVVSVPRIVRIGVFYFCRFSFPFRTFLFSEWSA